MRGHGGGGRTVLSQSEDQSRPHPAQHFLCTQCPRRSGAWALTRSRVALVLILRLRHAHETGSADRR